jgi:lysine 6-dehydrogenase
MANILVIGAGMVGSAMAVNLAATHTITNADFSQNALALVKHKNQAINIQLLDITDKDAVLTVAQKHDLIILAVPGFLGFKALKLIIQAGKPIVDISFFPENAMELDALAKEYKVPVIVDCGVAPGMSNIILGHYDTKMQIESFECMVGGLPKERVKPFEYKAPFSPIDVIEEYTRPARLKENDHIVIKPALTEPEQIDISPVGTLESFNTDGLRSLLFTMPHIPNMKEKTLRYPGHIDLIQSMKQAGFFDETPIQIHGQQLRPIDVTSSMLINNWKLGAEEEEFTIMRINIKGKTGGQPQSVTYDLYDEYCAESKVSSMARTTGYTACAAAELLIEEHITTPGILPPELIGRIDGTLEKVINYLEQRHVKYTKS